MKNFIFTVMSIFLLLSCSTGVVPKTSAYTKDQITEIAIEEARKTYGLNIGKDDTAIMKAGYGYWKVVLYGNKNPIIVIINEDGSIKSSKKDEYIR